VVGASLIWVNTTAYTIGHSTRSSEELLALLRDAGVELVADVRAFPASRRHPHFNLRELARSLEGAGLQYVHRPGLGGRRQPVEGSPNGGWRERAFQGYADHMASNEFLESLAQLEVAARKLATSVMCAEAVWWRCHRRLIADALLSRGWRVEHLGIGETRADHQLPEFAVVEPGGVIKYPPRQTSLLP